MESGHIRYPAHQAGVRIWETLEETVAAALAATSRRQDPNGQDPTAPDRGPLAICLP